MITPAAVGTWNWVEQTSQQELSRFLFLNPEAIIDSLAQEILTTRRHVDYPLYSKLFSLFYSTTAPLNLCLKITEALKSIGLFDTTDTTEAQNISRMYQAIQAHEMDKALTHFKHMHKNYGYEELCIEAFNVSIQNEFAAFIPKALETLTIERQRHILNKALLWAAETRETKTISLWIKLGASIQTYSVMEKKQGQELKTQSCTKNLFHAAVLTKNPELALLLIENNFDIQTLGDFNPLNHFIETQRWDVVKAYAEKYLVVQTATAPLTEDNLISLINYSLNLYQLISCEQASISIMTALLNSGFDLQMKFRSQHGSSCSLLEYIVLVGNGHAFLAMIRVFNALHQLNPSQPIANKRLAEFFHGAGDNLEDTVLNLLALAETRQTIFNVLFILVDTYNIKGLLEHLIDRDYSADHLLNNALAAHTFSDEFLLRLLMACKRFAFRESMMALVPFIIKSIKRRLTLDETLMVIKMAQNGLPAVFHALMQKELPFRFTKENNLLDVIISHFHCAGSIVLLLNNGFYVENCASKLLTESLRQEDELLLERALHLGADLDNELIDGVDPLAFTIYMNKIYAAKLLFQSGRDPDKVHTRPYKDASEDGALKPIELAIKSKRFAIALVIAKNSQELQQHILSYQALIPMIAESDGAEDERKELLEFIFKDFPFAKQALAKAPLAQFNNQLIEELKKLNPIELTQIESTGRSIFEIPWLLGKIHALGHRMLRCLSAYQCIFSLNNLDKRLGTKANQPFQHLLGIDPYHYNTIKVEPLLEPMIAPKWEEAVSKLTKIYCKYENRHIVQLQRWKQFKEEDLILGLPFDYPIAAKDTFKKHFNAAFLISELADILEKIDNPQPVKQLFRELFGNFFQTPTCQAIHRVLLQAGYILMEKAYQALIKKDELFHDENTQYSAQDLLTGIARIFMYTAEKDEYIGTPKKGTPEIEDFYAVMRRCLLQMLRRFEKCKDQDAQHYCLTEIGMAGNRCGGRWLGCLHQQLNYLKEDEAQFITFVDEIYLTLQGKRQVLFEELMNRLNDDVHIHNQIYKLISKQLGLPGGDVFDNIKDDFANPQITENRLLGVFYAKYHPLFLIEMLRNFLSEAYQKTERRELLILWIQSNLPDEFKGHYYLPIIEAVTKAVSEKKSRQEITPLLGTIYWNPDEPDPLKAIHNDRFIDFMDEVVMDEKGHFKFPFILFMLLKLKVLSKPTGQIMEMI